MIRLAQKEDLGELVRLARPFIETCTEIAFDEESFVKTTICLMTGKDSALWVIDRGGRIRGTIAGVVFPYMYNFSHLVAQEMQWWIEKGYQGADIVRLFDQFLEWAQERCAASVMIGRRLQVESHGLAGLYERRGFVENEMGYVKHLRRH